MSKKSAAPKAAAIHSTDGCTAVRATRTTAAAGRTILFGMMRSSISTAETATSTAQKNDPISASQETPKRRTHPASRAATRLEAVAEVDGVRELERAVRLRGRADRHVDAD